MGQKFELDPVFTAVVSYGGSDIHVKVGSPPRVRIKGQLTTLDMPALSPEDTERLVFETMDPDVLATFKETHEADYAISVPGVGRFRANAYQARGSVGLIARLVVEKPFSLGELNMPDVISELSMHSRGLVLVTGPTGSGKTTTLGGMVNLINQSKPVHILTIEDPIEIMHTDIVASINQREVRTDTAGFQPALKAAMRQDPDVILIGEMRDAETVHAALSAAETGHFVMSTLHTTDAAETINRIIDFFPPHEQKQVRMGLAQSLQGIVCQRLVPSKDGQGRVCVMEILVTTGRIADAIMDPEKTHEITDFVAAGSHYGMQTFDQHLLALVLNGRVSVRDAKIASTNPQDLAIKLKDAGMNPRIVDGEIEE